MEEGECRNELASEETLLLDPLGEPWPLSDMKGALGGGRSSDMDAARLRESVPVVGKGGGRGGEKGGGVLLPAKEVLQVYSFQRPGRHEEQRTVMFLSNGILGPFIQA